MVKTRLVVKKVLDYDAYLSYRSFLIKMVKNFNKDFFFQLIYNKGKKMEWKDVDMEPLPKHYKLELVEEEYEPEGTKEDPIEISSDEDEDENEDEDEDSTSSEDENVED